MRGVLFESQGSHLQLGVMIINITMICTVDHSIYLVNLNGWLSENIKKGTHSYNIK